MIRHTTTPFRDSQDRFAITLSVFRSAVRRTIQDSGGFPLSCTRFSIPRLVIRPAWRVWELLQSLSVYLHNKMGAGSRYMVRALPRLPRCRRSGGTTQRG